jgi:hypothetical protein
MCTVCRSNIRTNLSTVLTNFLEIYSPFYVVNVEASYACCTPHSQWNKLIIYNYRFSELFVSAKMAFKLPNMNDEGTYFKA